MQVWYLMCCYVGGGVVSAGMVSLTFSPYSSELLFSAGGWSASRACRMMMRSQHHHAVQAYYTKLF